MSVDGESSRHVRISHPNSPVRRALVDQEEVSSCIDPLPPRFFFTARMKVSTNSSALSLTCGRNGAVVRRSMSLDVQNSTNSALGVLVTVNADIPRMPSQAKNPQRILTITAEVIRVLRTIAGYLELSIGPT